MPSSLFRQASFLWKYRKPANNPKQDAFAPIAELKTTKAMRSFVENALHPLEITESRI